MSVGAGNNACPPWPPPRPRAQAQRNMQRLDVCMSRVRMCGIVLCLAVVPGVVCHTWREIDGKNTLSIKGRGAPISTVDTLPPWLHARGRALRRGPTPARCLADGCPAVPSGTRPPQRDQTWRPGAPPGGRWQSEACARPTLPVPDARHRAWSRWPRKGRSRTWCVHSPREGPALGLSLPANPLPGAMRCAWCFALPVAARLHADLYRRRHARRLG